MPEAIDRQASARVAGAALRNPYLDVFLKYCAPAELGLFGWDARTEWRHEDGFAGPSWDRHIDDTTNTFMARRMLCPRFSFSVPTDEAIAAIAELSPIVEIGAGTGYWAWLLERAGADVDAFDLRPGVDEENIHTEDVHWLEVRQGDHRVLEDHPAATLLLSWPPLSDPMGRDCLRTFRGDTLVYVGEGDGGCCADDGFFNALERGWETVREIWLPQWPGLHDYVSIWRRTSKEEKPWV